MVPQKYLILVAMTGWLISMDQLTKFLVASRFRTGELLVVWENFFQITPVHNTGIAFGLLSGLPDYLRDPLFFIVPGLTLIFILLYFRSLKENQKLSIYAIALIVGGALGNLMDRLRLGYVIDFLDFHYHNRLHFPAFNLADCAITLGVCFWLASLFFEQEGQKS